MGAFMGVRTQGGICILAEISTTGGPRRLIAGGLTRQSREQLDSLLDIHIKLYARPFTCQSLVSDKT